MEECCIEKILIIHFNQKNAKNIIYWQTLRKLRFEKLILI